MRQKEGEMQIRKAHHVSTPSCLGYLTYQPTYPSPDKIYFAYSSKIRVRHLTDSISASRSSFSSYSSFSVTSGFGLKTSKPSSKPRLSPEVEELDLGLSKSYDPNSTRSSEPASSLDATLHLVRGDTFTSSCCYMPRREYNFMSDTMCFNPRDDMSLQQGSSQSTHRICLALALVCAIRACLVTLMRGATPCLGHPTASRRFPSPQFRTPSRTSYDV
ncbi:hypothetical protein LZ30DRAFT_815023 [Colletotrichum cereale]|nr:hypothetical protein LZ30DRAFT_815023 [Colletotrichum cereale]